MEAAIRRYFETAGEPWASEYGVQFDGVTQDLRDVLSRLLAGEYVDIDELSDLQAAWHFDPSAGAQDKVSPDRVAGVLDIQRAMSLMDVDDAALPWNRSAIASEAGRYMEAALDSLDAAARLHRAIAEGKPQQDDDLDWADSAIAHACRDLARGGALVSAAVLAKTIRDDEERTEVLGVLKDHLELLP